MRHAAAIALLAVSIATRAGAQTPATEPAPTATASRTSEAIRVDGDFNEPAWSHATPIGPLRERDPVEESPASEATEVRVVYNDDALYVAVTCFDRTPDAIVSTQLTRDANLYVDDLITIVIDPFFDHRNGFFFQVNPAGARSDGQISNNSPFLSRDWDGIWNAAARRTGRGWQAEIVIPFKTLRFKPGQTVWGFNVERLIKSRNEIDRWAGARHNVWLGNLAEAGRLEGIVDVHQGLGLDVRPYGLAGDANDTGGTATGGLDVLKNLTPNLNAALTVNTDFAETEADTRQVNLTRFPLFFPEKRTFFLEGAGVYDMAGLGGTDLIPFFSRRVGLIESPTTGDNVTVPVNVGAKLTGRQSDYNVGVLDVGTGRVAEESLDRQNLFAARVSRNIFRQSWIGAIVTNGDPSGGAGNTLFGADARLATSTFRGSRNLSLDLFGLATRDATTNTRDGAAGFRLAYPNDIWDLSLAAKQIGDNFNPALGFVPRTGIRKTDAGIAYQPRPERWGVRQFAFELFPEYITNLQGRLENWRFFSAPLNIRFESGDHVEWNYIPQLEHLDEPFEIQTGVTIPAGSYQWTQYRAQANSASKRRLVGDISYWWGGFYDGTRREINAGVLFKATTNVSVSLRMDRNDIRLREGAFTTVVYVATFDLNLSPNLSWANLLQYDNQSRVAAVQSRFRWILTPGNDIFVVLNRGWVRTFEPKYVPDFDRAAVKVQYTFRL